MRFEKSNLYWNLGKELVKSRDPRLQKETGNEIGESACVMKVVKGTGKVKSGDWSLQKKTGK